VIQGFTHHRRDVSVAGVIFNRVASRSHEAAIREAVAHSCPDLSLLGFVPRDHELAMPERHLGLVQSREIANLDGFLDHAGAVMASCVDLEKLLSLAMPTRLDAGNVDRSTLPALGQRIAIARDDAFAFCYEATVAGWRRQGAEISFFSPLAGEFPSPPCDAIYLPGGYPELHAGRLAQSPMLPALRGAAARGAAIYGECGGYMVLGLGLEDESGIRHEMAGLLPLETSFKRRKLHLGYREIETAQESPLGAAGARFRGHEFHYATTLSEGPGTPLFRCRDLSGAQMAPAGIIAGRVLGSFVHLVDRAL
jgi:cobyrinic acid a,c-diamide synthase